MRSAQSIPTVPTVPTVLTVLTVLTVAVLGCGRDAPPPRSSAPLPAELARPADSLVLEVPGGITVWFTQSREARDSLGLVCQERALEVRQDSARRGVGLLYTREAPTLLGKDAMRAVLYQKCVPGPAYRVDFATLSPRRIAP